MLLADEIDKRRREIRTDSYPMSVGELASLYEQDELDLHPAFQRFFRWNPQQKSRWIESLILGIPTPSVFVAQRKDGVWDVVDGVQRLSTIFQFMGILKGEDGRKLEALTLEGTKLLRSLDSMQWQHPFDTNKSFPDAQKRMLKREKLDIKIILSSSEEGSEFELFQRLNTGGSFLSDQELRNCVLISISKKFYEWIDTLARHETFRECVCLSERLASERFDLELIIRFLVFRRLEEDELGGIRNLSDFLDDKAAELARTDAFPYQGEQAAFEATFDRLAEALGEDTFRRYDGERSRFRGPFLVTAFEVIALGLGYHHPGGFMQRPATELRELIKTKIWAGERIVSKPGESAPTRIPRTIKMGRDLFA